MDENGFYSGAVDLFKNMGSLATAVASDNTILIQQLHKSDLLTVYLLAGSSMPTSQRGKSIVDLRTQIADHFNRKAA